MRIAAPQMLWLIVLLVGPLIAFLWWAWRKREQLITQFISTRLLGHLKVGFSPSRQKARLAMIVTAVVLIIFALARPQWGVTREEARLRGLDIILAVDTSNSMLAEDVSPNRLARAKLAALDLMKRAKTDRLGLVAFAGDAFLECPLTLDDAAFSQSVNALDTTTISQGGTAVAEAINEARKAFKKESDAHKVLVLLTDGEDHDSDAVGAAENAAKEGVVIFTVGIGTPEGEVLRIRNEQGQLDYIRDEAGNPVKSKLDEDLLRKLASVTKGFYLPLRGTKTMDSIYDQGIAPLPKSESSVKTFQNYHERYQWPLALAAALLILEMFLPDRSRRRSKKPPVATAAVVPLAILLMLPMGASASPGSALREYNDGKYDEALKDYNQALEKHKDDPRLHFNAGAAAYQSRHLDEAAKEFNEALAATQDLQLQQRAYYNLANTMYRAGQQASDPQKKQEAWENAIKGYESALKLNPQDPDAKFNQDFVTKQLEELKKQQQSQSDSKNIEPSDAAKRAKAIADEQMQRRNYRQALETMESQLQRDPTTSYYQDYMKRLKEVVDVQENTGH
ncbi:MAG TPA: VWA domain-containing protein [Verrucomicrobiae bacterium]|nr:VWA domain-containing protein [Verrucomicrobiae bacterium]